MKFTPLPSLSELARLDVAYDPATGVITVAGRERHPGKTFQIKIGGRQYTYHRIVWKLVTGEDPPTIVDHHDGDEWNNKWENLRLATSSQNNSNCRRRNSHVHPGVHKKGNRYEVRIKVNGRGKRLGGYATAEEAIAVRVAAEKELHGDFAYSNRTSTTQQFGRRGPRRRSRCRHDSDTPDRGRS